MRQLGSSFVGVVIMLGISAVAIEIPNLLAQPSLSNPAVLPGDAAISPAAGLQESPQVACGANGCLAVWTDDRASIRDFVRSGVYFGEGLGTLIDIYAARLDTNGNLLDTMPIVISQAQYNQTSPRVGWNGQNWLVVWMTEREGNRYYLDVVGVRVSPGGAILDSTPIVINPAETAINLYTPWSVSSDGANWVVIWRDLDAAAGIYTIDGARIAPNGSLLDPGGRRLRQDTWNSAANKASLAFAQDEYLMTWLELDCGTWSVRGQRLTPALVSIGAVFTLNLYSPSQPERPTVTTNGTDFLVVWSEERYYGFAQLFGTRVSHAGVVQDPSGIQITSPAGYTMFQPGAVWSGSNYLVAYNVQRTFGDEDIYLTRISSAGNILDPSGIPVRTGAGSQNMPSVGRGISSEAQLVWADWSKSGDVQSSLVSSAGAVVSLVSVTQGAPRQSIPRFARSGTNHLIVFRSEVAGEARILAQRLDGNGSPIDLEPVLMAAGTDLTNPSAAWNGSNFLVVWEKTSEGRGQIYARRLDANGTLLDSAPVRVMQGLMPDVGALGDDYLVVATDNDIHPDSRTAYAVRVDSYGTVLVPRTRLGGDFDVWPRVTGFGSRWLAVWEENVTHDDRRSVIVGAFVGADGQSQGAFAISDGGYDDRPQLAVGGETALVVWEDRDIFGRRVQSDGSLRDTARGIVISGAPEGQFRASVAYDGTDWVVSYLDHRDDPYPRQERGDIFAARVGSDGSVLDPDGFAVANSAAPEETPAVEAADGVWLLAYAGFLSQSPYAALRIALRSNLPPAAAPATCTDLRVTRNPNGVDLDLTWSVGCGVASDYAVYEGAIGDWYSHLPARCSTGGVSLATVTPGGGNRYFLVVSNDATTEGSYGTDSRGIEIPPSPSMCRPSQRVSTCPR